MKKNIILVVMIFFLMDCASKPTKSNKLYFEVEVYENKKQVIENKYPVKITIQNNSDSLFDFWLMSCSFEDSFIFSSDVIRFFNQDCDKNIPKLINLEVGEKYELYGNVEILDINKLKGKNNLRMGFILIKGSDYNMHSKPFHSLNDYIFNRRRNNNYLWSDIVIKFR